MGFKRYYVTSNIHAQHETINFASACVYRSTSTTLDIYSKIIIIMTFTTMYVKEKSFSIFSIF